MMDCFIQNSFRSLWQKRVFKYKIITVRYQASSTKKDEYFECIY